MEMCNYAFHEVDGGSGYYEVTFDLGDDGSMEFYVACARTAANGARTPYLVGPCDRTSAYFHPTKPW